MGLSQLDKLTITSGKPGSITIEYTNGQIERLHPITKRGGLFSQFEFTPNVSNKNGLIYTKSAVLGDIYLKHTCHFTPRIPYERCGSQGTGEEAKYSHVTMNIAKDVLVFGHGNICHRY